MAESNCEIGGISLPDCFIRKVEAILSTGKLFNIYQFIRPIGCVIPKVLNLWCKSSLLKSKLEIGKVQISL
jgi:hypothetical protein